MPRRSRVCALLSGAERRPSARLSSANDGNVRIPAYPQSASPPGCSSLTSPASSSGPASHAASTPAIATNSAPQTRRLLKPCHGLPINRPRRAVLERIVCHDLWQNRRVLNRCALPGICRTRAILRDRPRRGPSCYRARANGNPRFDGLYSHIKRKVEAGGRRPRSMTDAKSTMRQ
jgi:hypothetical protein